MGKGNRKHAHISTVGYRVNYEEIFGKKGVPDAPAPKVPRRRKVRLFDKNNGPGEYTRSLFTGSTVYESGTRRSRTRYHGPRPLPQVGKKFVDI